MNRFLSTPLRRDFFFLVLLPFFLWMACFWGFISGRLLPDTGEGSYYQQTLFFVNNIIHGVYPFWDPTFFDGSPYAFFLRRIGDANPFYLLIAGAKLLGVPDLQAYRIFITGYYFLAVSGFWLIARLFLRHRLAWTGAFLILLFSGWSSRAFSDYIILMFVPLVWFFYFLFAFAREGKKHQFLGMFLAAAIAMTTYIPFFFMTTVGIFLLLFMLFFGNEAVQAGAKSLSFIRANKVFALGCLVFFAAVMVPAASFFQESKHGEFIMPGRNVGTSETSTLAVSMDHVRVGDLMAQGYFDRTFEAHKDLMPLDFFVTYFFFLVLLLSVINPLTRSAAFLLANILFLLVITVTESTPVYKFLYDHVFLFKYMRMMSFLFWIAAFPMAVFFVGQQLDIFLQRFRGKGNIPLVTFIIAVHLLFVFFALRQEGIAWTSWLVVAASLAFFIGVLLGKWSGRVLLGVLFFAVIVQPLEFACYLAKNTAPSGKASAEGRFQPVSNGNLQFWKPVSLAVNDPDVLQRASAGIYCGTRWYQDVYVGVPLNQRLAFVSNKIYLIDNTATYDENDPNIFLKLGQLWRYRKNVALLPRNTALPEDFRSLAPADQEFHSVREKDRAVRVLSFDANSLKLRVDLDRPKFLLWADGYYSGWHVFINGKPARLLRADHAFKGVWVPAGENTVFFRFLSPFHYAAAYLLLALTAAALLLLVFLACREYVSPERIQP